MVTDHWPVLMGYDTGYGPAVDGLLARPRLARRRGRPLRRRAGRRAARGASGRGPSPSLLLFAATNLAVALVALPHVPGNPRYILFLMSVVPVFLADALGDGARRRRAGPWSSGS